MTNHKKLAEWVAQAFSADGEFNTRTAEHGLQEIAQLAKTIVAATRIGKSTVLVLDRRTYVATCDALYAALAGAEHERHAAGNGKAAAAAKRFRETIAEIHAQGGVPLAEESQL